jgi:hypothetical protein
MTCMKRVGNCCRAVPRARQPQKGCNAAPTRLSSKQGCCSMTCSLGGWFVNLRSRFCQRGNLAATRSGATFSCCRTRRRYVATRSCSSLRVFCRFFESVIGSSYIDALMERTFGDRLRSTWNAGKAFRGACAFCLATKFSPTLGSFEEDLSGSSQRENRTFGR